MRQNDRRRQLGVAIFEALRALRLPAWSRWEATGQSLFAQGLRCVLHHVAILVGFLTTSADAFVLALVLFRALGTYSSPRPGKHSGRRGLRCHRVRPVRYVLGMALNPIFLVGSASGPWRSGDDRGYPTPLRLGRGERGAGSERRHRPVEAFVLVGFALTGACCGWRALCAGVGVAVSLRSRRHNSSRAGVISSRLRVRGAGLCSAGERPTRRVPVRTKRLRRRAGGRPRRGGARTSASALAPRAGGYSCGWRSDIAPGPTSSSRIPAWSVRR
jgi:hypothetical protein